MNRITGCPNCKGAYNKGYDAGYQQAINHLNGFLQKKIKIKKKRIEKKLAPDKGEKIAES